MRKQGDERDVRLKENLRLYNCTSAVVTIMNIHVSVYRHVYTPTRCSETGKGESKCTHFLKSGRMMDDFLFKPFSINFVVLSCLVIRGTPGESNSVTTYLDSSPTLLPLLTEDLIQGVPRLPFELFLLPLLSLLLLSLLSGQPPLLSQQPCGLFWVGGPRRGFRRSTGSQSGRRGWCRGWGGGWGCGCRRSSCTNRYKEKANWKQKPKNKTKTSIPQTPGLEFIMIKETGMFITERSQGFTVFYL